MRGNKSKKTYPSSKHTTSGKKRRIGYHLLDRNKEGWNRENNMSEGKKTEEKFPLNENIRGVKKTTVKADAG